MITTNSLYELTLDEYAALRFNAIKNIEGEDSELYFDSVGNPTIGIGFNLRDQESRNAVLNEMGFDIEEGSADTPYIESITALLIDTTITDATILREQLDFIMADWSENGGGTRSTFDFSPGQTGIDEMRTAFDNMADVHQRWVVQTLGYPTDATGNPIYSRELVALTSLAYNSHALIGTGLRQALADNNRAEAWFEIRYNSNSAGSESDGIAKRRYYESQLFGLYDEGVTSTNITTDQALAIFQTFTLHREKILGYEVDYLSQIASANSDYGLSDTGYEIQSLETTLIPATENLLNEYVRNRIDQAPIISFQDILVDPGFEGYIDAAHFDNANNLVIGRDGSDTLIGGGGDDVLDGAAGNDHLHGGSGNNYLFGGADNDTYIIERGSTNTITDSEGINTLLIDGRPIILGISNNDGTWSSPDGALTFTQDTNLTIVDMIGTRSESLS